MKLKLKTGDDGWHVLADWLMENGDPERGEQLAFYLNKMPHDSEVIDALMWEYHDCDAAEFSIFGMTKDGPAICCRVCGKRPVLSVEVKTGVNQVKTGEKRTKNGE